MSDQLFTAGCIRLLTLVDNFSRESLAIEIGKQFTGDDVVRVFEEVCRQRGYPKTIRVDNGPECMSKSMDLWAYCQKVKLDFSRLGKPTDNATIESFKSRFREEYLDQHRFLLIEEAIQIVDAWRHDYNHNRPHSSLANKSPIEFLRLQACGLAHMPEDVEH